MSNATTSRGMFAPLAVRDFRMLFAGLLVGQAMMPIQFVAQIIWIQQSASEDKRILLVGLIAAVRGAGMMIFGLFGGALADRFDRRKLLIATQGSVLVLSIGIGTLMVFGDASGLDLIVFYILTFFGSALAAVDLPTRQAIVPDILGRELTATGVALNAAGAQIAMPAALIGTGIIIAALGPGWAIIVGSLGFLAQVISLLLMRYKKEPVENAPAFNARAAVLDIAEGLRYTRHNTMVLWVIVVLVVMMGLGFPAVSNLGPTWVTTVVGVPVRDFGYVAASWGLGSLIASLALARFPNYEHKPRQVLIAAFLFGVSFLIFASSKTAIAAAIGNFGLGMSMAAAQIAATATIQLSVPNALRGRVMSVLSLNMGVSQLMTLPFAAIGQQISLQVLFPALALTLLTLLGTIALTRRVLWRARVANAISPTTKPTPTD